MAVPPLGLGGFGVELWNCDLHWGHGHFVGRDYSELAAPFGILVVCRIVIRRPDLARPKQSTRCSRRDCTSVSNGSIRSASSAVFGAMRCLAMCPKLAASQSNSVLYMVNTGLRCVKGELVVSVRFSTSGQAER